MSRNVTMLNQRKFPKVDDDFISFQGGLDLESPPLFMKSGFCRAAQNFEADSEGGYRRVAGYERHDGRAAPSAAGYWIMGIALTGAIAVGNTVTGLTSGATGKVVSAPAGQLVLARLTGVFQVGESVQVAAVTQATATSLATPSAAATAKLHAQYLNLAADDYRPDILAVPGSGRVLGVLRHNGVTFAFRNNSGATAADLYKSSAAGWVLVPMKREIFFTAGSGAAPAEGATITKGAVSAVVRRVMLETGTWAAGTAAGRFIIDDPAGGEFTAGAFTAGVTATASGASAAIVLLPSGRYRFHVGNFGGTLATRRAYGADGVNRGFEFDGAYLAPIRTGMVLDAPTHVRVHRNHLFFAFGSSLQHSGIGVPYNWTALAGAGEIAVGDEITGLQLLPGSESVAAMAVFSRNSLSILYGTSSANWQRVPFRDELSALADSVQDVGFTIFLDDRGISTLQAAQVFGNFAHAAMSDKVSSWLKAARSKFAASCIIRDKNQYRLFFSDRYALHVTLKGDKLVGIMPILMSHKVECAWSSEESDGTEVVYFGSDTGMVYQLEKGTSFDGEPIEHYLNMVFNFSKSPRITKRYRECALEVSGTGYAEFDFTYQLGYGSSLIEQPSNQTLTASLSTVNWDAFVWDSFIWDGITLLPVTADMVGTAENVSIIIRGSSDYQDPLKLSGAMLHYTVRRGIH